MTGMRPPVIAGVGGGVGTTTVAVALRGSDESRGADTADILVCRGTLDSLRRAAAVLDRLGAGPRPVLAVTLDGTRVPRGPLRARLQLLEPAVSAVVLLPHVGGWRTVADPLPEVARLLVDPADRVPRPLRRYTAALRELADAVAASGRLQAPPSPVRRPDAPGRRPPNGTGRSAAPPAAGMPDRRPTLSAPAMGDGGRPAVPDGGARRMPPVVGAFHPVVAAVPARTPQRGVRIVGVPRTPPVRPVPDPARRPPVGVPDAPVERTEQVG